MIKKINNWSELPPDAKDAALRGLKDPEGSGRPDTTEQAVADFNSGMMVASLGNVATGHNEDKFKFCGDCLRNIPFGKSCAHISVGPKGGVKRIG